VTWWPPSRATRTRSSWWRPSRNATTIKAGGWASAALRRVHEPWRLSAYQVQSALLGVPEAVRVTARLTAPEEIIPDLADQIRDELREFTRLGGFAMRPGSTAWFGAAIGTRAQAHEAIELAVTLSSRTLPQVAARLGVAAGELGLPDAAAFSYPERTRLTRVLALLHQAGQPGRGCRERRALRREAQAEWAALLSARSAAGAAAEPRLPSGYAALAHAWDECERQLAALRALAALAGLEDAPEAATAALAADQEMPWKLPRLRELAAGFGTRGLAPLLDEVGDESVAPDEVAGAFCSTWSSSTSRARSCPPTRSAR